ncbi:hypothetical protein V1460_17830 [Streptomyces sp. SCSIO 30461]|uniref:hypothetical protein n=1 Tax=Streptomyces sp. SCSIO 30461 TaxID=3118085 RepID=UPI0030CC8875
MLCVRTSGDQGRSRLHDAIEALVDNPRQWNIEADTEETERAVLRALQEPVEQIARRARGEPVADDD